MNQGGRFAPHASSARIEMGACGGRNDGDLVGGVQRSFRTHSPAERLRRSLRARHHTCGIVRPDPFRAVERSHVRLAAPEEPLCPQDMVFVEGDHCSLVEQKCLEFPKDQDGKSIESVSSI